MSARVLTALAAVLPAALLAQTAPREGIQDRTPRVHALVGARLLLAPGRTIESGTLVLRDGLIEAAGGEVTPPADARIWDASGLTVTAGFIDLALEVDWPEPPQADGRAGRSWNPRIRPERTAVLGPALDGDRAAAHRAAGFALAVVSPAGGVLSGTGALLGLHPGNERRSVIAPRAALFGGLDRGGGYPSSRMGAVALLRQTLHDASWYRDAWAAHGKDPAGVERPEVNRSLEALEPVLGRELPLALRAGDALELLTLARVVREFGVDAWYVGSGREFAWREEVAALSPRLVLPLDFPEPPPVERPDDAAEATLRDLEEWARAPENPVRLHRAGVRFALTPRRLKSARAFPERLRRAMARGLPPEAALAALTTVPAEFLGLSSRLGTLERGKLAALAVFDGEPFAEESRVVEVWIDGERHPLEPQPTPDLRGSWRVAFAGGAALPRIPDLALRIAGEREQPSLEVPPEGGAAPGARPRPGKILVEGDEATLVLPGEPLGLKGSVRLGGTLSGHRGRRPGAGLALAGSGRLEDGTTLEFRARRTAAHAGEKKAERGPDREAASAAEPLPRPLGERGRLEPPLSPAALLVEGATVWTSGPEGIIEDGSLLVEGGKVRAVGRGLRAPPDTLVVRAGALHLTPGIIDAHSHTAIAGGVNEGTQAVTAEVRVVDAVWADDPNLYRQLAGGVTAAQLLHGSANPIGGQSAIIKLRWGEGPAGLEVGDPPKTIKFALGENPKRSNRQGTAPRRYPQSRMGVEQIIRDSFLAARDYARAWEEHRRAPPGRPPPRRDLELEALAEVLRGERLVHCHSYRQDELLMMMRLAEEMGFRVGTFQHVLEGYKVASEIAAHGAGASTFSDWWAYKFEVYDAIPYNGALLHRAGVVTSFNSDSGELARRLNLEAAKAVKYGGVPPAEALKFVTLNPARQLRMEGRIGSLEPGKDADFVVWSGNPLSTRSRCLETWIDGRRMWSREEDLRLRERDGERLRTLIGRILESDRERKGREPREDAPPPAAVPLEEEGR